LRTALIVSRYFPPLGSAGASIRLVKFMKYAAREGWRFIVLTEDIERPVIIQEQKSGFLLDEVPADTEVIRVVNPLFGGKGIKTLARAIFKDSSLPWGLNVIWRCIRQVKKESIDLIYANAPPFTNPFIGCVLKFWYGHPYVFDMKDDWVGTPSFEGKNKIRRVIEMFLEGVIIRSTEYTVLVTQASLDKYKTRYRKGSAGEKLYCISNGCDLDEYEALKARKKGITTQKFTMLGVGSGYRKGYRDLIPLIEGIGKFFDKHPDAMGNFSIEFLGNEPSDEFKVMIDNLGIQKVVKYCPAVGREEFVERLWGADLLFEVFFRGVTTGVSGTLYEYWAAGKAPVLLVSEEGAASKILKENQLGEHALFDEVEKIAAFIEKVYLAYKSGSPLWISREGVERYSRKELTAQMVQLWNRAIGM
jgi:glycosyltransferase involved in cell wall biosynthesis